MSEGSPTENPPSGEANSTFIYSDSNLPGSIPERANSIVPGGGVADASTPVETFVNQTQFPDGDYTDPEGLQDYLTWGLKALDVIINKRDHYSARAVAPVQEVASPRKVGAAEIDATKSTIDGMLGNFNTIQFKTPLEKLLTKQALLNKLLRRMDKTKEADRSKMALIETALDDLNFDEAVNAASTKIVDTAQSAMAHASVVPYQADTSSQIPCPSFGKETQVDTRHYKQALAAVGNTRFGEGNEVRDSQTYLKTIRSICNLRYAPVACYDLTMYLFVGELFEYCQIAARNGTNYFHFWTNFQRMLIDKQKYQGNKAKKDLAKLMATASDEALSIHLVKIFNAITKCWENSESELSPTERSLLVQHEARSNMLSYIRDWYPTSYPILKSEFDNILRQPGLDHRTFDNFSVIQALASKIIGNMRPISRPFSRMSEFEAEGANSSMDSANFEQRGNSNRGRGGNRGRGRGRGGYSSGPIPGFEDKCYLCGGRDGHTARTCRKYPGDKVSATQCPLCTNYHSSDCLAQTTGMFSAEGEKSQD